ncbi:MAG: CvpA family protein [Planctomycetaceae bacterium]|nr:CvpA family protein [Planctomycetaceae bacterium]
MLGSLLLVLIAIVVGSNFKQGIWGNCLRLFAVITAALCATNFCEPIGAAIETAAPTTWQYGDFLGAWIIFVLVNFGLIYLSMKLSPVSVRFSNVIDQLGGVLLSAACGWVLVCFTLYTLHFAPVVREPLFGSFKAETPMFFGFYPDRMWLAFAQQASLGVYSNGDEKAAFDPQGDFLLRMIAKREQFEQAPGSFAPRIRRTAVVKKSTPTTPAPTGS